MTRPWILLSLVVLLTACASPQRFEAEPAPEAQSGGLAEPVMEPAVANRQPTMLRPRASPAWVEDCVPGDDGIGGTGCRID